MNNEQLDELIDETLSKLDNKASSQLIPLLQSIQDQIGYLSRTSMEKVAEKTKYSPSHIYGVATFYHQFRLKPEGKHIISLCQGTACHVAGAKELYGLLQEVLRLTYSRNNSQNDLFTIHEVRCLGACSLAPVMKIDEDVYGKLTPKKLKQILNKYKGES